MNDKNKNGNKNSSSDINQKKRPLDDWLSDYRKPSDEDIHSLSDLGLERDGIKSDHHAKKNFIPPPNYPAYPDPNGNRKNANSSDDRILRNKATKIESEGDMAKKSKKKKKKKKPLWRRGLRLIFSLMLLGVIVGASFTAYVIMTTPKIDPNNLYDMIHQPSTIYDDKGNVLESVSTAELRENINIDKIPEQLKNAFIAIEDKTFYEHHGFNVVRLVGAVKDGIFHKGRVSGTSTITQQLAKNLYLSPERSLTRKIREAYYAIILEKNLTKNQILEAYLNSVPFGYNSYGVQAAANSYFGCDVGELTLAQCATLASIPKSPAHNSPLRKLHTEDVESGNPNIIATSPVYTTVYNDGYRGRQELVLKNMLDQDMISQSEYENAMKEDIRSELAPGTEEHTSITSYFADYCISEVKKDLMHELKLDEKGASDMIYKSGLKIYSTIDQDMQSKAEDRFSVPSNLPSVTGLKKDRNKNILNANGNVLLYNKGTYFNSDDSFSLKPDEYTRQADGSLAILAGHRLNIYKTNSNGKESVQIEFKDLYTYQDGLFYCIRGGYLTAIPPDNISRDHDGNAIISQKYLSENPDYFVDDGPNITISPTHFTLRQMTIQPQAAMVVTDYTNGQIKVMVGGRSLHGRLLYNRAINPRQPGSSIKPIAVYGPAIQSGVEKGSKWTAGTTIEDSENIVDGKVWPRNWYSGYKGWITLRTCVEQSVNVPSVRLLNNIGPSYSVRYLEDNGISTVVKKGTANDMNAAALALGGMTDGISPIEMASAYGTFPNGGEYIAPVSYTKIEDSDGNVILEKKPYKKKVYDKGVAYIMTDILQTTVSRGIAGRAAFGSQPVGGKTGTTTDNYDAWFVGFTPQFAASVWIGNDVNIELSQGSGAAASLWSRVMKDLTKDFKYGSFKSRPDNVVVINGEYFVKGTSPSGPPVTGHVEKLSDKYDILTDEDGNYYYMDEKGNKVYVSEDPETGDYKVLKKQPEDTTKPEDSQEGDTETSPENPTATPSPSKPTSGEHRNPSDVRHNENKNENTQPPRPQSPQSPQSPTRTPAPLPQNPSNPSPPHGVINDPDDGN